MAKEPKILKLYVLRAFRRVQGKNVSIIEPKTIIELEEHEAADVVSAAKAEIYDPAKHDKLVKESKKEK